MPLGRDSVSQTSEGVLLSPPSAASAPQTESSTKALRNSTISRKAG